MASSRAFLMVVAVAIAAAVFSQAESAPTGRRFNVGDGDGWKYGGSYQDWADQHAFIEGDTLVFKYTPGQHNVLEVNPEQFKKCDSSKPMTTLESGHDEFILPAGVHNFICGFEGHCQGGNMMFTVNVEINGVMTINV